MPSQDDFVIFDRNTYFDLADDEGFLKELADSLEVEPEGIGNAELWDEIGRIESDDLANEVSEIDHRFEDLGAARLFVRGAVSRWNGVSEGFSLKTYPSFKELISDTGYDGIFKDCEIDRIFETDGSLVVVGVHHDGRATFEARGLDAELACEFDEITCSDDDLSEEDFAKGLRNIWNKAIRPDMAGYYGRTVAPENVVSARGGNDLGQNGKEDTMSDYNDLPSQETPSEAPAERTYVSVTFPAAFVHPYVMTDRNGNTWEKAVCSIPPETSANGIDLSGYGVDVFLKDFHKERIANGEPVVFRFPEEQKVELFTKDLETGERKTMNLDPWALTNAVKKSREAFAEKKQAERLAPADMRAKAIAAANSHKELALSDPDIGTDELLDGVGGILGESSMPTSHIMLALADLISPAPVISPEPVTVRGLDLGGEEARAVTVEARAEPGSSSIVVDGFSHAASAVVATRIRSALRASVFEAPRCCVTLNLAGCDELDNNYRHRSLRSLDLAISVAVLAATGQISPDMIRGRCFEGAVDEQGLVSSRLSESTPVPEGVSRDELITATSSDASDAFGMILGIDRLDWLKGISSLDELPLKDADGAWHDPYRYTYQFLSRLQTDCDYFLGMGGGNEKDLWAGTVDSQIEKMRECLSILPDGRKPDWICEGNIDSYEADMRSKLKQRLATDPRQYRAARTAAAADDTHRDHTPTERKGASL